MSVYLQFPRVFLEIICYIVFPSGWNFKLRTKEFPNYPTTISTPNSYMLIPHNIAHYMEVYNIIYHILHQPHRFPKVNSFLHFDL